MRRSLTRVLTNQRLAANAFLVVAIGLPWPALAAPTRLPAPNDAQASAEDAPASRVVDVALGRGGMLLGQFVTAGGKPVGKASVGLSGADNKPVVAATNDQGGFGYRGLKGGVYRLRAGQTELHCRVWAPGTAPPKAARSVLLVEGEKTLRGQQAAPRVNELVTKSKRSFANPLFVATVAGAAVAIPVAIANSDDDDPSS